VDGTIAFHLHPAVFSILMQDAGQLGVRTCVGHTTRSGSTRGWASVTGSIAIAHAVIFRWLAARGLRPAGPRGLPAHGRRFRAAQNARVDEAYVVKLLAQLPPAIPSFTRNPSLDDLRHEFDALVSSARETQWRRRAFNSSLPDL